MASREREMTMTDELVERLTRTLVERDTEGEEYHVAVNPDGIAARQRIEADARRMAELEGLVKEARGEVRLCVICGQEFDADLFQRGDTPCGAEDEFAPCTLDMTYRESWEHWRKLAHERAARLAEVEQERDEWRDAYDKAAGQLVKAAGDHAAAEARAERLATALRFYADERLDGYDVAVTDYGLSTEEGHIIRDGGEIARAALQQEGGE
jgi:hypothetical protein